MYSSVAGATVRSLVLSQLRYDRYQAPWMITSALNDRPGVYVDAGEVFDELHDMYRERTPGTHKLMRKMHCGYPWYKVKNERVNA